MRVFTERGARCQSRNTTIRCPAGSCVAWSRKGQASLVTLNRELGINPKTVAKWRKRQTVDDLKTGPKEPRSTVLTEAEEATVVAFRRHTLLPLDDCLYALQPSIPHPLAGRRMHIRREADTLGAASVPAAPRSLSTA